MNTISSTDQASETTTVASTEAADAQAANVETANVEPGAVATEATATVGTRLRYRRAYAAMLPIYAQMDPEKLRQVNADVPSVVTTCVGCLEMIQTYRPQVVEELPRFPIDKLDNLEACAMGAGVAHTQFLGASAPAEPLQAMAEKCSAARDVFATDIEALAKRGLLDGSKLKELRGTNGFKNIAWDTMFLSNILRQAWPIIAGRTGVSLAELDEAEDLADRLTMATGHRDQGPSATPAAADTRQRAFTYFMDAYEEVRRAISYLRWHQEDVDDIIPSLYANKRGPKKDDGAGIVAEPVPAPAVAGPSPIAPSPAAPSTNNGGNGGVVLSPSPLPGTPASPPFNR